MRKDRQIEILNLVKTLLGYTDFCHGICGVVNSLLFNKGISIDEHSETINLLNENKPTPDNQYKVFTENDFWVDITIPSHTIFEGYWWLPIYRNESMRQIRIDYITKLIDNLK